MPGAGLLGSSEGRVVDDGVFSAGRAGFGDRGVLMIGTIGIGVGEEDDVGVADDDVELSTADDGGDDTSEEVAEGMMFGDTFHHSRAVLSTARVEKERRRCLRLAKRVSRGSKQRKRKQSSGR